MIMELRSPSQKSHIREANAVSTVHAGENDFNPYTATDAPTALDLSTSPEVQLAQDSSLMILRLMLTVIAMLVGGGAAFVTTVLFFLLLALLILWTTGDGLAAAGVVYPSGLFAVIATPLGMLLGRDLMTGYWNRRVRPAEPAELPDPISR